MGNRPTKGKGATEELGAEASSLHLYFRDTHIVELLPHGALVLNATTEEGEEEEEEEEEED